MMALLKHSRRYCTQVMRDWRVFIMTSKTLYSENKNHWIFDLTRMSRAYFTTSVTRTICLTSMYRAVLRRSSTKGNVTTSTQPGIHHSRSCSAPYAQAAGRLRRCWTSTFILVVKDDGQNL